MRGARRSTGPSRLAPASISVSTASNLRQLREEVRPYLTDPRSLDVWSKEFFHTVVEKIEAG